MVPYIKRETYLTKIKKYGIKFVVLYGEARTHTHICYKVIYRKLHAMEIYP
jgi:hypothetical protein